MPQAVVSRQGVEQAGQFAHDGDRANVATAHKMLRIVHALLRKDKPYEDPTIDYEQLFVKRNAARWLRMLKKHGLLRELQANSSSPDR